jgi:hypothetical protein
MKTDTIIIGNSGLRKLPFIVLHSGYIRLPNGDDMYIPKGFCFDNGSIPKLFKFLYDTFGIEFFNYRQKAFLVHDFMYRFKGYQLKDDFLIKKVDRPFADFSMKWILDVNDNKPSMIKTYFYAVRLLGWLSFGRM